jgi:hypothetical protein
MVKRLQGYMGGRSHGINQLPRILYSPKGLVRGTLGESSFRNAMSIAKVRTGREAPLGAACYLMQTREPAMPLLAELADDLLGPPGYKHGAPNGAMPAQTFE